MTRCNYLGAVFAHALAAVVGIVLSVLLVSPTGDLQRVSFTSRTVTAGSCEDAHVDRVNGSVGNGAASPAATAAAAAAWSCRDFPTRCAIVFHAFALSQQRLNRLIATARLGEEFWMAWDAAVRMKHESSRLNAPGSIIPRVVLVTNYPLELLHVAQRNAFTSPADKTWPFEVVTVPFYDDSSTTASDLSLRSSNTSRDRRRFVSKPDGLLVSLGDEVERVLYLDSDTTVSLEGRSLDALTRRTRQHSLLEEGWCAVPPSSKSSKSKKKKDVAAADAVVSLLDVFDTLELTAIAMVPEFNCFRDGASWLYTDILDQGLHVPRHHPLLLESSVVVNTTLEGKKNARRKKSRSFQIFAPYEVQFNTGVIAYRPQDEGVQRLLKNWSRLHRTLPRCMNDTVAWDQCSLPHALRSQAEDIFKIFPLSLPSIFNAREALGRGCSPLLYKRDDGELVRENIVVSHMIGNKQAAMARILRGLVVNSTAVACFDGDKDVDCSRKHLTPATTTMG